MKLPDKVRVAHVDVNIESMTPQQASSRGRWGEWTPNDGMTDRIEIGDRSHPEVVCTLIHEINHVVWWAYELEKGDEEERVVGVMATAWAQIYRDNPELVAFIASGDAGTEETIDEYIQRKRKEREAEQ